MEHSISFNPPPPPHTPEEGQILIPKIFVVITFIINFESEGFKIMLVYLKKYLNRPYVTPLQCWVYITMEKVTKLNNHLYRLSCHSPYLILPLLLLDKPPDLSDN